MSGLLNELTVESGQAALRAGHASSEAITAAVLDRIRLVDPLIHAFEAVGTESALAAARKADRELADGADRGPLHGLPIALKDIIDTVDLDTTASSRLWRGRRPAQDAAVAQRLREAGAIIVGKTVTHEFAFGVTSPPTRSPWDLGRVAGGSSGGSAAAVAADACIAAIGTDTGGSIRIPSANCGVVGVLGTYGRVSTRGVAPLAWSLDYVGPIAKNVRDAALILGVIAGFDKDDRTTLDEPVPDFFGQIDAGVDGLRIGVPRDYFFRGVQPYIASAVTKAAERLSDLGADVIAVDLPGIDKAHVIQYGILSPEAASFHYRSIRSSGDLYQDDVRQRLDIAQFVPATHYVHAQRLRYTIKEAFRHCYETNRLDVLIAPTTPEVAVPFGEELLVLPEVGEQTVIGSYVRLNCPFNLSGQPVLSLPCGFTDGGLPIGMQVAARPLQEAVMLRVAAAYQAATDWHERRPELATQAGTSDAIN